LESHEGPGNHHHHHHHQQPVDEIDDQEDTDLEVELINLDYNFRPINSPPYNNHGYPYLTQSLPRQVRQQPRHQQYQLLRRERRNSTGSDGYSKTARLNTSERKATTAMAGMAGLNEYQRSRGTAGFTIGGGPAYSYYDQGDSGAVPSSDRVPSRAGGVSEYYIGGNRATSPYNLQGVYGITSYSPRLASHGSYHAGFPSGGDSYSSEGGHSSRPSTRNFNLCLNSPPGFSPTTDSPEGCSFFVSHYYCIKSMYN